MARSDSCEINTLPLDSLIGNPSYPSSFVSELSSEEEENPFFIHRASVSEYSFDPMSELPSTDRSDAELLFVIIILVGVLTAGLIALYRHEIILCLKAVGSWNFLIVLSRSKSAIFQRNILYFNVLFFITGGMFLYLILDYLNLNLWEEGWPLLFFCMLTLALIYALKISLLKFLGWLFDIQKEVKEYLFVVYVFNAVVGIVIFPMNVFLTFGPENMLEEFAFSSIVVLLIVILWRQFRIMMISLHKVLPHAFHFFLYLCAVEFAPVLLIFGLVRQIAAN